MTTRKRQEPNDDFFKAIKFLQEKFEEISMGSQNKDLSEFKKEITKQVIKDLERMAKTEDLSSLVEIKLEQVNSNTFKVYPGNEYTLNLVHKLMSGN